MHETPEIPMNKFETAGPATIATTSAPTRLRDGP